MPQANGCNLEALTKPRCKDVEEVRVQLLETGEFMSFKSATLHIFILNGSQLLRFLLRAWQQAMLIRAEECKGSKIVYSVAHHASGIFWFCWLFHWILSYLNN